MLFHGHEFEAGVSGRVNEMVNCTDFLVEFVYRFFEVGGIADIEEIPLDTTCAQGIEFGNGLFNSFVFGRGNDDIRFCRFEDVFCDLKADSGCPSNDDDRLIVKKIYHCVGKIWMGRKTGTYTAG